MCALLQPLFLLLWWCFIFIAIEIHWTWLSRKQLSAKWKSVETETMSWSLARSFALSHTHTLWCVFFCVLWTFIAQKIFTLEIITMALVSSTEWILYENGCVTKSHKLSGKCGLLIRQSLTLLLFPFFPLFLLFHHFLSSPPLLLVFVFVYKCISICVVWVSAWMYAYVCMHVLSRSLTHCVDTLRCGIML